MQHPVFKSLMLLTLLAACSEKATLSLEEKAKYTAELIEKTSECAVFAKRLSPPPGDSEAIRKVYEEAKAAYCIKPDV